MHLRKNKSKMIHEKLLSICNKKTKTAHNSRHVCTQFDLGGGSTKIAHVNILRSIQAAPEEESNTVEEQAVAEEQVSPNPTVDDGGINAVAITEDNATPVAMDASSTTDTINDQSLLDDININDESNKAENAVGGGDTEERASNITETNDTSMLEDNLNTNPPAETSVQESSPVTQTTPQMM